MYMPPLDEAVVALVRDLWPEAQWTESMRQEWRARLSVFPVDRVVKAVRDSYAERTSKQPRLDDVIVRTKASAEPRNEWKDRQPTMRDIEQDIIKSKKMLKEATKEKKERLVILYRERVGTDLPPELEDWKRSCGSYH